MFWEASYFKNQLQRGLPLGKGNMADRDHESSLSRSQPHLTIYPSDPVFDLREHMEGKGLVARLRL